MKPADLTTVRPALPAPLPDADPTSIRLRSYQAEMVEESLKQNIIVAMDTGSGKTHVAISRSAAELESCEPHKLVWFLAPTVTLCHQQSCLFEKYLPAYQLRFLSGSDNVDRWTDQKVWDTVLNGVRVVVSTPAVLLDALTHAFVKLPSLALLIFDEAHMCRGNHPASAIMQKFYHPLLLGSARQTLPKILGLTASPVLNARAKGLELIEQSLNAVAKTPKVHRTELLQFTHRPVLIQLPYPSILLDVARGPPILAALNASYHGMDILQDPYVIFLRQQLSEASDESMEDAQKQLQKILTSRKTYVHEQLKKLYSRACNISAELGGWATEFYIRSCIAKYDACLISAKYLISDWSEDEGKYLQDILSNVSAAPRSDHLGDFSESISPKMETLVDLLLSEARPDFTGIIFVEQRATVAAMAFVLSNHPQTQAIFNVGTFVGTSTNVQRKSHLGIGDLVELKHQQQTLDEFRAGKKNLIIATSVLEEGIDVSNCHIVICYEPPKNIKSFIQRRGRARKQDSKFVIMLPEDSTLANSPAKWLELEEEMKEAYLNDLRQVQEAEERELQEEEGDLMMRCENTGALLTLDNAVQHLYHFCAILGGGQHVDLRPRFAFTNDKDGFITATVTLPTSVDAKVRRAQSEGAWMTERQARKDAAFQAYKALHRAGLVNDNLLPLLKDPDDEPDFGVVEKRPSNVMVATRLDPWVSVANAMEQMAPTTLWHRRKISILLEEADPTNLVLLLPILAPSVPDFLMHWNEVVRYTVRSETLDPVLLGSNEVRTLQRSTRDLLFSVFGTRMSEERFDFLALFAPQDGFSDGCAQRSIFTGDRRPAIDVFAEIQAGNTLPMGLVRQQGNEGHPMMFRGFHLSDSQMSDETADDCPADRSQLQVSAAGFPKRRDFLHPVKDIAQHGSGMYARTQLYPAKDCLIDCMPAAYSIFSAFIPSIIHRYELFMIVQELCQTVVAPVGFTDHELVLRAITASSTTEKDYQRLEFLGDCILKFCTAVQLMAEHIFWPESYLTERKDRVVSNGSLAKASRRAGLDNFIITKAFTGTKWRPRYAQDVLTDAAKEPVQRSMSTKILADVVESLIGTAYVEGGLSKADRCIAALVPNVPWRPMSASRTILAQHAVENQHAPLHLEQLESLIGYTFKNKHLLLEAVTHASFIGYREVATSSYQRLEFLGDAILDYLVVRRLYPHVRRDGQELPHHAMHGIRTALVNASFLAFLCMEAGIDEPRANVIFDERTGEACVAQGEPVRKALWQFMRHSAPTLPLAQAAARARHEELRDEIWRALRGAGRYPWPLLARTGAEKFFSDLIESLLGAIFVDSAAATPGGGCDDGYSDGDGDRARHNVLHDAADDMTACESFLSRLGLMDVLARVLADEVDCLHPKEQLGRLAVQEKVNWEWDIDEGAGVWRCRVAIGERSVGDWVEGKSRVDAETEAADRAVRILVAEGVVVMEESVDEQSIVEIDEEGEVIRNEEDEEVRDEEEGKKSKDEDEKMLVEPAVLEKGDEETSKGKSKRKRDEEG